MGVVQIARYLGEKGSCIRDELRAIWQRYESMMNARCHILDLLAWLSR